MNIVYPAYWIWFLALPVSLGIIFLVYRRVAGIMESWFAVESYKRSYPFVKFLLRSVAYVLLFIALLGPYWGEQAQQLSVMGREIYLLMDVSASMNADDLKPSRLEKAKVEVRHLIEELKGDKIGLIIFADNAYVQCPLTTDFQAVNMFLELVSSEQFAQSGTNFRSALSVALSRFQSVDQRADHVSRAVVMISDGEDFGDTYTSIIDRFKQAHIGVFTVGIGTAEGAFIPNMDKGFRLGYKTHEDGTTAISQLHDETLKEIALHSGTTYVRIDAQNQGMDELIEQIKLLSASPLASRIEQVKNNQYQIFLAISLVLLMISLFLMPIRTDETND